MLIFGDESVRHQKKVVGAISITRDEFFDFENKCCRLRIEKNVLGEIKWGKVKRRGKYFDFYISLIKKLFNYPSARFHSNSYKENQYKAGYSLVRSISWKLKRIGYIKPVGIIFDKTGSLGKAEIDITKTMLVADTNFYHEISLCQQTDSKTFNTLQIADLLVGCVAYKLNIEETKKRYGEKPDRDEFITQVETLDAKFNLVATHGSLWGYDSKKIQHYDLPDITRES